MKHVKWTILAAALAGMAACGADGDPVRPSLNAGVSVSPSGVQTSTTLGLTKGPISIGLSL